MVCLGVPVQMTKEKPKEKLKSWLCKQKTTFSQTVVTYRNLETGQCPMTISKFCFTERLAQVPVEGL